MTPRMALYHGRRLCEIVLFDEVLRTTQSNIGSDARVPSCLIERNACFGTGLAAPNACVFLLASSFWLGFWLVKPLE